jgi:DNA-binding NarL/FixJ family response regulator
MKDNLIRQSDLINTGREALNRGAWQEARASFEAALALSETPEALEGLGVAAMCLDDAATVFDARERAYRLYRERSDRRAAARVATWLAWNYKDFRGEEAIMNGWLRRAHRLIDDLEPGPEHVWLAAREAGLVIDHDAERARQLASEAVKRARSLGLADLEMLALSVEGIALVTLGQVDEGMALLDEVAAAAAAGEVKDPAMMGLTCCNIITGCQQVFDFDRAAQWCDKLKASCERWQNRPLFAICRIHYAGVLLWRGAWADAEAELAAAANELLEVRPAQIQMATLRLAELRHRQGRFHEAAELFAPALAYAAAQLGRARLALDEGDARLAANLTHRYLRKVVARAERVAGLELMVQAQVALSDLQQAQVAFDALQALVDIAPNDVLRASTSFAAGIIASAHHDYDTARWRFEDAVDLYQQNDVPFEAARCRIELARALYALDDWKAAAQELQTALVSLRELGAVWEAKRAGALLGEMEAKTSVKTALPTNTEQLTPRELEVLGLVAEGLSNQEIANLLNLSEHTVHRHVSSILGKLGVTSRAAAAAYAARHRPHTE